jgi:hypothetical protein
MSSNPVEQSSHTDPAAASGQPPSRPASRPRYGLYTLIALAVIVIFLFLGWLPRHKRDKQVAARQECRFRAPHWARIRHPRPTGPGDRRPEERKAANCFKCCRRLKVAGC